MARSRLTRWRIVTSSLPLSRVPDVGLIAEFAPAAFASVVDRDAPGSILTLQRHAITSCVPALGLSVVLFCLTLKYRVQYPPYYCPNKET